MPVFRLRNFLCDYSLLPPSDFSSKNGDNTREREVPVIHMFGATESGKKACVHIHGALPYFVMRVGGELTERVEQLMCQKLNKLLHAELNRKKAPGETADEARIPNYVHHLEAFQAKSIYGYHSQMETFARVFFTNPFYVLKLSGVLGQLSSENPIMQPFEAHVPFILQFFIDHSIFGMDWVHFKQVKYRIAPDRAPNEVVHDRLTAGRIRSRRQTLSPLPPATTCYIEVDVSVKDILNKELHSFNVHSSNPGLDYIWREEAERCKLQNRSLEDAFNQYTPRPYPKIRTEKEFLERLRKATKKLDETSSADRTSTEFNDTPRTLESTYLEGKDAESIWSQALQETEKAWSDTQDIGGYGLEEEWHSPDYPVEEEEPDNPLEMTVLVGDAGEHKPTEKESEKEEERNTPSVLETTIFEPPRDMVTPGLPDGQGRGQWYRCRKQLPLKRRVQLRDPVPAKPPASEAVVEEPPLVKVHTTMRNKMQFDDESVASPNAPESASPDAAASTDGNIEETRSVCVASLELFISTDHKMPNPTMDAILAVALCITDDACCEDDPIFHSVIRVASQQSMPSLYTITVPTERDLFDRIIALMVQFDPDILVGYDTHRLSWGYLIRRAEVLGLSNFHHNLSRYSNPRSMWQREERGGGVSVDGRLLESVWRAVRRDLTLRSYDRATACFHILKKKMPILDDRALTQLYRQADPSSGWTIHYHLRRMSLLNILLLNTMDWFIRNAEMAKVYGIQFHEVWTRGSQLRVESMLLRLAHKLDFVAPSVTVEQRDRMCAPEQLQLIMEPESKVYHDPVIVLDFQSLYPSMVIAYNYCFSTLFGKIANLTAAADVGSTYIEVGAVKYAVEKESLVEAVNEKKVHSSPLCTAFARATYRQGVVVTMLREVLGARIMVKTAMKNTKSKRLLRILDARQLALKLVANVTYGYTAANWSGRMPCVEVADAILAKGRETLERAICQVNSGDFGGARVIYGDTDSMFVLVKGASLGQAFEIGRRIAQDVTAANPAPVVLKLEKVYTGCVLETKKRYAGWMYESEKDTPRLDAKGIETVRRDTCPIVSKILERSLEYILQKRFNKFLSFLDRRLTALNDTPYTEFVFCKEYRGDYDPLAPVPQKKVAEYNQQQSPGYYPLHGERLAYVVVAGEPDSTVISCVRSIEEFLEDEELKINVAYYIRAHILAALHRVTDLIPMNIDYLDETSQDCFNRECDSMGGSPWCRVCAIPNETHTLAVLQRAREQRILSVMKMDCMACQRSCDVDIEACTNSLCATNKVITAILRSNARLAVIKHRRHFPKKTKAVDFVGKVINNELLRGPSAGPLLESPEVTVPSPIVAEPTVAPEPVAEEEQVAEDEQEEEVAQEEAFVEEEIQEEEEEYHDRTIFHFGNDDEETRW